MATKTAKALLATALLAMLAFSPAARAAGDNGSSWGYNYYGQLGIGSASPLPCQCEKSPTPMAGVSGIVQLSASQNVTLALLADGTVRAWGAGFKGQLGNGETANSATGVAPTGLSGVIDVAASNSHGLALLADGTVMAWGENSRGELGLGSSTGPELCTGTPCSERPVAVPGLSGVIAVAAGTQSSSALLANGTVVAWGWNAFGEVGDGTGSTGGCECVDHPVPVPGVSGAMALSEGGFESLALLADGTVRAWGKNEQGGLGNGAPTTSGTCKCLGPVPVGGLSGVKAVSAGEFFGLALLADGGVRAWGYNADGQLGNGAFSAGGCACIPSSAPVDGIAGAQDISAGANHGLALLADGSVRAWGDNESGELGNGTTSPEASPIPVAGISGVAEVHAGELNSYALSGASQMLTITITGSGSGVVGGSGILCGPSCSARFPNSQVEALRAEPGPTSAFAGFAGACSGTTPCQVRMDQDQSVVATFGPPTGTAITAATINRRKKTATFSFSAPGPITGYECQLIRPKPKPKKKHRARRKAKTPPFAACSSAQAYRRLKPGAYTFSVRALDSLGADEHPAVRHFKLKPPKKAKPKGRGHKG